MKILNLLLPTAFLAVLVIGLTLFFTTEDREVSEMENRELQTANFSTSVQDIISGKLTKKVESYISDQFAFRDDWMKTFVKFQSVTGKTVIKDQYYVDARTGWIVSKAADLVPEEELDAFVDDFTKIQEGLSAHDIPMAFFTFPAKATYIRKPSPSFVPEDMGIKNNARLHEKLTANGIDNTKIMDAIPKAVDVHDMYFKTDHHWNMFGAYQGYLALMKNVNERIGEKIEPIPFEEKNMSCLPNDFSGSWNKVLYLTVANDDQICYNYPESFENQFTVYMGKVGEGKEYTFNDIYGGAKNMDQSEFVSYATGYSLDYAMLSFLNEDYDSDKHIVIVKDSYMNAIQFHVASHFKQTTILDLRYTKGDPVDLIAELDPDYVFFAYNDRNFNVVKQY